MKNSGIVRSVAFIAAFVILANLVAARFVATEHKLYTADHVAYWSMSSSLAKAISESPAAAAVAISDSVAEKQLNLLPALPIAAIMLVLGDSRLVYILSVLNLYALPALALLGLALYRSGLCRKPISAVVLAIVWLPSFWYPMSLGYLGVGGLVLAFIAIGLYFDRSLVARRPTTQIAIGVILAGLYVFRRWYAFWSLSFGLLVVADCLVAAYRSPGERRPKLLEPLIIGGATVMTLVAVALPRVLFDLNSDYGDRFAAFKVHQGVLHELSQWPDFFGALPLVLVIFAGAFLVREVAARRFAIFLGAQTVIIFVTMRQVQDPTPQHFYLYFATFVPILALAIARLRVWPRLLTGVLGFLVSIFVFVAPASVTSFGLLPQVRVIPEQRTDLGEIHRLLQFLDAKLARDPGFIAIIGYTPTMSDTAMAHANLSLSRRYRSPQRILLSSQMDTRDGFPTALLYASLVVVTDPLQCRQPAVDQRVVEIPGKAFLEGRHIARAFVRLPETFALQYGVTAYVFERRRMTTHEELAALSEELRAYYPDRPDVYAPPPDLMGEPALTEGR